MTLTELLENVELTEVLAKLKADENKWKEAVLSLANERCAYTFSDSGMTFLMRGKLGNHELIADVLDTVSTYSMAQAREDSFCARGEGSHHFMPHMSYGGSKHTKPYYSGILVPFGEDVHLCTFKSHGFEYRLNGVVEEENEVVITAYRKEEGDLDSCFIDEETFLDLADAFDFAVHSILEAGVDMDEVQWHADWCNSVNFYTGEMGTGFLISTDLYRGFPDGCKFTPPEDEIPQVEDCICAMEKAAAMFRSAINGEACSPDLEDALQAIAEVTPSSITINLHMR